MSKSIEWNSAEQLARAEIKKMSNDELSYSLMETAKAIDKGGATLSALILQEGALRISRMPERTKHESGQKKIVESPAIRKQRSNEAE
jgi:uncharacterized membrane protein